jgi:hypothetical protein
VCKKQPLLVATRATDPNRACEYHCVSYTWYLLYALYCDGIRRGGRYKTCRWRAHFDLGVISNALRVLARVAETVVEVSVQLVLCRSAATDRARSVYNYFFASQEFNAGMGKKASLMKNLCRGGEHFEINNNVAVLQAFAGFCIRLKQC